MSGSKEFIFKNYLEWNEDKIGTITSQGKPSFKVTTPSEFGGNDFYFSPEDLFIASLNSCLMTTFLYYAEKSKLKVISYKSKVVGKVELKEKRLVFTQIEISPEIVVDSPEKAERLIKKAEDNCLISNSVKTEILIKPTIKSGN